MLVLLFELAGATYALKLEAVSRILPPDEPLPEGYSELDLADLLGLGDVPAGHVALLSDRTEGLRIGRPVGTAHIEPSWILPLPGYMFRLPDTPIRGIIEFPASRKGRAAPEAKARGGLLLDDQALLRMKR